MKSRPAVYCSALATIVMGLSACGSDHGQKATSALSVEELSTELAAMSCQPGFLLDQATWRRNNPGQARRLDELTKAMNALSPDDQDLYTGKFMRKLGSCGDSAASPSTVASDEAPPTEQEPTSSTAAAHDVGATQPDAPAPAREALPPTEIVGMHYLHGKTVLREAGYSPDRSAGAVHTVDSDPADCGSAGCSAPWISTDGSRFCVGLRIDDTQEEARWEIVSATPEACD
jgi:hypothetical protein